MNAGELESWGLSARELESWGLSARELESWGFERWRAGELVFEL